MKTKKAQSVIELLTTYSWALLIVALFIIVVFVLSGSPTGQSSVPTVCNIQPLFPCLDSILGTVTNGHVPYYLTFVNNLNTPIYLPSANSFNLTTAGIGVIGTVSTLGSCTPNFAPSGTKVYCNANVVGSVGPSTGTNVNVLFSFQYQICSNNVQSSCTGSLYRTTGSSTVMISTANTANIP